MLPAPTAQGRGTESQGPSRGLGWRWGGRRGSQAEQGQARADESRKGLQVKVTAVAGPAAAFFLFVLIWPSQVFAESRRRSCCGAWGLGHKSSGVVACGLSCSAACGVLIA